MEPSLGGLKGNNYDPEKTMKLAKKPTLLDVVKSGFLFKSRQKNLKQAQRFQMSLVF
jgi:hypothetical protein